MNRMIEASPTGSQLRIALITEEPERTRPLASILARTCGVDLLPPAVDPLVIDPSVSCIVLDVDLSSTRVIRELEPVRRTIFAHSLPSLLVIDKSIGERMLGEEVRRAKDFGVRNYIYYPFEADEILRMFSTMDIGRARAEAASRDRMVFRGVSAAHGVLAQIFELAHSGSPFSFENLATGTTLILDALDVWGINPWMETVRRHHGGTYRHSLLVTGFAVAFSQKLRMRAEDQQRIARAALLHDVGKSFIPLDILDKPGKLTAFEMEQIRKHPRYGYDLLTQQGGFADEILDAVLHHHEFLDGTGYPDRLQAAQIADLVRIITIADIFAALVEDRPYRQSLSPTKAFGIMQDMAGKLDVDLLNAFKLVVEDAV
ncbi:MAG TPA: HD domain-containing phosphohydrolase [Bradyrhizobium sp.]|nr:HD domain-containing phosphohydrolase [Bradyrhizobium sp.]